MTQPKYDWPLVARLIDHEVTRYPGGKPQFIRDSKVSSSSLNKAIALKLTDGTDIYDRIEDALHLPDRTFQFVLIGELDELTRIGVDPGLVTWLKDGGHDPIPKPKRSVGRTA